MPLKSVDLVFGSPPYVGKGKRYGHSQFIDSMLAWAEWMTDIVIAACRVSRGPVMFVINDAVADGQLIPATHVLIANMLCKSEIRIERPLIWFKNSPPNRCGSGKQWFSNTYETIVAFSAVDSSDAFDWEKLGTPKKYDSGGRFRQRTSTGERRLGNEYPTGKLARPRDVIQAPVGGGMMGHKLRSQNEAPFPESLVEKIIPAFIGPEKTVLDPFCGSGTTLHVAHRLGASSIGIDIRQSQIELTKQIFQEMNVEVCDLQNPVVVES
jgi:site-specific DNA-methyltransferase (adenine-specific)